MSTFDEANKVLAFHEGGWCDVPGDKGGETNFGWSTLTIKRLGLSAADLGIPGSMFSPGYLKPMRKEVADQLYKKFFWDKGGYSNITDQASATKVFDFAVNAGIENAARVAQRACGATVDGQLGPKSFAAINAMGPAFVPAMRDAMVAYYEDLIRAVPSDEQFRSNWIKRAQWGC
jgi:lysozyme family protein